MTRPIVDVARPDADSGHPLRRVPGAGGCIVAVATGWVLSRWSDGEVAAAMATAGLPGTLDPVTFAIVGALVSGVVGWAALYLVWGRSGWLDRPWHPRAAARRPLSFDDLGPPPPREQPLPSDLDQPLSAFDPDAIAFHRRRLR